MDYQKKELGSEYFPCFCEGFFAIFFVPPNFFESLIPSNVMYVDFVCKQEFSPPACLSTILTKHKGKYSL